MEAETFFSYLIYIDGELVKGKYIYTEDKAKDVCDRYRKDGKQNVEYKKIPMY